MAGSHECSLRVNSDVEYSHVLSVMDRCQLQRSQEEVTHR
jgi:hypothetical protein